MLTEFEWKSLGFDIHSKEWPRVRPKLNNSMLEAFYRANRQQKVDVVVGYLSGHDTDPETVRKMGQSGAIVISFSWDDKLSFGGRKLGGKRSGPAEFANIVDLTNSPQSCIKYMVHGALAMFWPEAAQ